MVTVHIAMHSIRPMEFHSKNLVSVATLCKDQLLGLLQMVNQYNSHTSLTSLDSGPRAGNLLEFQFIIINKKMEFTNSTELLNLEKICVDIIRFFFVFFQPYSNTSTNSWGDSTLTRLYQSKSIHWITIRLWTTPTTTTILPTTTATTTTTILQKTKPLGQNLIEFISSRKGKKKHSKNFITISYIQ